MREREMLAKNENTRKNIIDLERPKSESVTAAVCGRPDEVSAKRKGGQTPKGFTLSNKKRFEFGHKSGNRVPLTYTMTLRILAPPKSAKTRLYNK